MAKTTKEFEWHMQGMITAHKIVKEGGIDALTKEIRMRNMLKVDLWAKKRRCGKARRNDIAKRISQYAFNNPFHDS